MKKFIALLALGAAAAPSFANDSSAAIGLGGLELTRNDAISMDSEDLFLSRQLVTVKYGPSGDLLWTALVDTLTTTNYGVDLATDAQGGVGVL